MALQKLVVDFHRSELRQRGCEDSVHFESPSWIRTRKEMDLSAAKSRSFAPSAAAETELEAEMDAAMPNVEDSMTLAAPPFSNVSRNKTLV